MKQSLNKCRNTTFMFITDDAEFMGCFKDTGDRAMTGGHTQGNDMTVDLCNKRCASKVTKKTTDFSCIHLK